VRTRGAHQDSNRYSVGSEAPQAILQHLYHIISHCRQAREIHTNSLAKLGLTVRKCGGGAWESNPPRTAITALQTVLKTARPTGTRPPPRYGPLGRIILGGAGVRGTPRQIISSPDTRRQRLAQLLLYSGAADP